MNVSSFFLIVLSVCSLVVGQLLLKKAMSCTHDVPVPWRTFLPLLSAGIGTMTLWFLLWLKLLQTLDLSYVYPFEGLSAIFLSLGAAIFLKEKLTLRLWVGIVLILLGVMFVSLT